MTRPDALFVTIAVSVGVPVATLLQDWTDSLKPFWGYLGWLALALFVLLQVFSYILIPLGSWMKGIVENSASNVQSLPTDTITWFFIILVIIIIVVAVVVSIRKPKVDFVEEFEKRYGKVDELREDSTES